MSLAKQVKKLNLESENTSFIDEEVVVPSIEEQLEAEEAEAELVEVLDEVEENQDALEESEEVEAEIDDHIAEAEATVAEAEGAVGDASAEAEGPAAEEGETPAEASEDTDAGEVAPEEVADTDAPESVLDENGELPVEEVVAAQEALQNLLKRTGYTLPNRITVSREDVRSNPLEAYKMNLEDWKDLKEKVKAGAEKIWQAILKAYAWIKEQIAKVFPSKAQKISALLAALQKANIDSAKLTEVAKTFDAKYNTKYPAIAASVSEDKGLEIFMKDLKRVAEAVSKDPKSLIQTDLVNFASVFSGDTIEDFSVKDGMVTSVVTEVKNPNTRQLTKENAIKLLQKYNAILTQVPQTIKISVDGVKKLSESKELEPKALKLAQKMAKISIQGFKSVNSEMYIYVIGFAQAVLKAGAKAEAPKAE